MGTRAMVNFKMGNRYLSFYSQYDGGWQSLGKELLLFGMDTETLEVLEELDKGMDMAEDWEDFVWDNETVEAPILWDLHFTGRGDSPDVEHGYNYLWDGSRWFGYDYLFKCWRPLNRIVKRDYIHQLEWIFDCFRYDGRFSECSEVEYFTERQDVGVFYFMQNTYVSALPVPFMVELFQKIGL